MLLLIYSLAVNVYLFVGLVIKNQMMRLQNVLEEAERASRAIKELANDLKQNPNALLLGKDNKP
jgi:glucosamine 6-phosphate synthetase-like amidotransferase/phosphosugar isomerase protein